MSDASEKPFEPTPQRLEKARRDGDVARSSELSANAAFAGAVLGTIAVAQPIGAFARLAIAQSVAGNAPWASAAAASTLALVPLAGGALAGVAAGALQTRCRFAPLRARFDRLNPIEGLKRMFSRETLTHGARAGGAFVLAAGAIAPVSLAAAAESLRAATPAAAAAAAWRACERMAFAALAVGTAFAVAEYAAARGWWLRKLRMSFEERRRESKEQEGDPIARGRRRTLHRAFLLGAISDVKNAAFVVANPTHVAVALDYRPPDVDVPRVLVRAAGDAALRVRELACAFRIPVVEDVALARALYRNGRVGEPIGRSLYAAVAEIVVALSRRDA